MANETLEAYRQSLLADIDRRVADHILEPANAALLKKLILKADDIDEANMIAALGTTYKRTGFHFDKRLEKTDKVIHYFRKNEALSFHTDDSKPVNKLVIGDNYLALQNLLIQYSGRVNVIYIDPPYGKDSMGEFAKTNYENAISRDNLLSMLFPRLMLAKQLLSDDGVIFCSIDDRNQAYVKCLFDEVFGERNSAGTLLWQKKDKPSFLSSCFGSRFEYVLCYLKDSNEAFPFSLDTTTVGKKYPLNNAGNSLSVLTFRKGSVSFNLPDGVVRKQNMSDGNIKTILLDDVTIENCINMNDFRLQGEFRYSQSTLDDIMEAHETLYIAKIPFRPNHIKAGGAIKKMENMLSKKFMYDCETNEDGTNTLISILGEASFDNPKPVGLIHRLLQATTYNKQDAIVLDFFAGSGTTGHAVLALNEKDGGTRQFILCQLNEKTENTPNGIAYDVTAKRLKRIMTGECYDGSRNFKWTQDNLPYGGNLDVYEMAEVTNDNATEGNTPFDVIDETLYGQDRFTTLREKVAWVCGNFQHTQKYIESNNEWEKRQREADHATGE